MSPLKLTQFAEWNQLVCCECDRMDRLVADHRQAAGTEIATGYSLTTQTHHVNIYMHSRVSHFFFFFQGTGTSMVYLTKWPVRVSLKQWVEQQLWWENKTPTRQRAAFTPTIAPRLYLTGWAQKKDTEEEERRPWLRQLHIRFFPPCLKGPLCSQCSETKEEDMPGRERGSKGGKGGVGEALWTSARDALPPCNSGLLTHRILQAQQTLPQGFAAASPPPTHPRLSPDTQPTQPLTWDRKAESSAAAPLRPFLNPLYTKWMPLFHVFAVKRTEARVSTNCVLDYQKQGRNVSAGTGQSTPSPQKKLSVIF